MKTLKDGTPQFVKADFAGIDSKSISILISRANYLLKNWKEESDLDEETCPLCLKDPCDTECDAYEDEGYL